MYSFLNIKVNFFAYYYDSSYNCFLNISSTLHSTYFNTGSTSLPGGKINLNTNQCITIVVSDVYRTNSSQQSITDYENLIGAKEYKENSLTYLIVNFINIKNKFSDEYLTKKV